MGETPRREPPGGSVLAVMMSCNGMSTIEKTPLIRSFYHVIVLSIPARPGTGGVVYFRLLLKGKELAGKLPSKLASFFHGEQDSPRMQGRPGGGDFVRHKEVSSIADVFLDIAAVCFLPRQPDRDHHAGRFQALDALWCDGQANFRPGRRAREDDAGCATQQRWKRQRIERTPRIERLLTQVKLVRCGLERQTEGQDVARLIHPHVR